MTDGGWFALVALAALSLASMTIRGVTRYQGWPLAAYLCSIAFAGALGGGIALSVSAGYLALGVAIGIGAVELGPAVGAAVRKILRAKADRL